MNAWWEPLDMVLPVTREQASWQAEIDTFDLSGPAGPGEPVLRAGDHRTLNPRSVCVLRSPRPGEIRPAALDQHL